MRLVFRVHALRRMFERGISDGDVRQVLETGEVIEEMICVICRHGETRDGTATVTLERGGLTLVVKGVPARVCESCGEEYVDEETAARLLRDAEQAAQAGVQVEVRAFAAA